MKFFDEMILHPTQYQSDLWEQAKAIKLDNKIKTLRDLYPNVKIDAEGYKGFSADGWIVWTPGSPKEYFIYSDKWTSDRAEARVFDCVETAVAVCESHQFFSCSPSAEVARVSKESE